MLSRLILLVLSAVVLQACGEGTTGSKPMSLTFVSSNLDIYPDVVPHNIDSIEIKVAENLDPNSVNVDTVHLMVGDSNGHNHSALDSVADASNPSGDTDGTAFDPTDPNSTPFDGTDVVGVTDTIEGLVWFNSATNSIHFEPLKPLEAGTTYHIRIHNVKLADGTKISVIPRLNAEDIGVVQYQFTTTHLHEVLRVRYDKDGNESAYVTFSVENNALKERRQYNREKQLQLILQYNVSLPPPSTRIATRVYRNPEGDITQYDYDIVENGVVTKSLRIKDAGADLVWGTDDDLLISWSEKNQQHLGHTISKTYTLIDKSQMVAWSGENTPGFQLRTIYLEEHAGPNFEHRDVFYKSLGNNGEIDVDPVTQDLTVFDDNISLWHKRDFFNGKRVRSWSINGVGSGEGADGKLFTEDDIASGLTTMEYYPEGSGPLGGQLKKLVTYYSFSFTAPMNTWIINPLSNEVTPSATVHSYRTFEYDVNGNRTQDIHYSPGPDGIMETFDDYVTQRKTYSTLPTITGGQALGLGSDIVTIGG